MNIYCCCLQKYVNKLIKIRNEPRSHLPTGIIGKQVCFQRLYGVIEYADSEYDILLKSYVYICCLHVMKCKQISRWSH